MECGSTSGGLRIIGAAVGDVELSGGGTRRNVVRVFHVLDGDSLQPLVRLRVEDVDDRVNNNNYYYNCKGGA